MREIVRTSSLPTSDSTICSTDSLTITVQTKSVEPDQMYSKFWPKGGLPGILHHYTETLVAFEFTANTIDKPHSLIFIGGLSDGVGTTSYLADVTKALEPTLWSLFTLNLSSSYQAWGLGHLDRDTDEVAKCVQYVSEYKADKFKGSTRKTVIFGHSTGSQDILHYLSRANPHTENHAFDPDLEHILRPAVDGAIMQAAVSDREVIKLLLDQEEGFKGHTPAELKATFEQLVSMSEDAVSQNNSCDTLLPLSMTSQIYPSDTPLSARRFLSLTHGGPERPGEDDMFSSDLSDAQLSSTFGRVGQRGLLRGSGKLMVVLSGADQAVPEWVDKEKLMQRWQRAAGEDVWNGKWSGIIQGASHALSDDDQGPAREELVRRVCGFLRHVEEL